MANGIHAGGGGEAVVTSGIAAGPVIASRHIKSGGGPWFLVLGHESPPNFNNRASMCS